MTTVSFVGANEREIQLLVLDELVEFENWLVEIQDLLKITHIA